MTLYVNLHNMARLSASIPEEQMERIEELAGSEGPYGSKSEVVRECINRYDRVDELETEVDRLHRERRQLLEQRSENQELQRYVKDEQRYRQAGLVQRLRWWIGGMD